MAVKKKLQPVDNLEQAKMLIEEAKQKREAECGVKLEQVLNDANCQIQLLACIGDARIPLAQILNLPVEIRAISK